MTLKAMIGALAATLGFFAQGVQAAPLVWSTADNMVAEAPIYLGGAQVSVHGHFTFDASTGDLSDWAFFEGVRGGPSVTPISFLDTGHALYVNGDLTALEFMPVQPDTCGTTGVGCIFSQILMTFAAGSGPTDAGGTVDVSFGYDSATFSGNGVSTLSASVAAVPLPGSIGLLALGAVAFGALRRRT